MSGHPTQIGNLTLSSWLLRVGLEPSALQSAERWRVGSDNYTSLDGRPGGRKRRFGTPTGTTRVHGRGRVSSQHWIRWYVQTWPEMRGRRDDSIWTLSASYSQTYGSSYVIFWTYGGHCSSRSTSTCCCRRRGDTSNSKSGCTPYTTPGKGYGGGSSPNSPEQI